MPAWGRSGSKSEFHTFAVEALSVTWPIIHEYYGTLCCCISRELSLMLPGPCSPQIIMLDNGTKTKGPVFWVGLDQGNIDNIDLNSDGRLGTLGQRNLCVLPIKTPRQQSQRGDCGGQLTGRFIRHTFTIHHSNGKTFVTSSHLTVWQSLQLNLSSYRSALMSSLLLPVVHEFCSSWQ